MEATGAIGGPGKSYESMVAGDRSSKIDMYNLPCRLIVPVSKYEQALMLPTFATCPLLIYSIFSLELFSFLRKEIYGFVLEAALNC